MQKIQNYLLSAVFIFLSVSISNGQKLKVKWGNYGEAEKRSFNPSIFGEDSEYFYTWDIKKRYLILEQVEKSKMKPIYHKKIKIPTRKRFRRYLIEGLRLNDGIIEIYASYYTRWERIFTLERIEFDAASGRYLGVEKILVKDVDKKSRKGVFNVRISESGEFVFAHFSAYYKKLKHVKEEFYLFNGKGKQIIKKARIYENSEAPRLGNYLLDNEGSVYFIQGNQLVILDKNLDYEYWSQTIVYEDMPLGGFINSLSLDLTPDNDIVIFGSYLGTDYYEDDQDKKSGLVKNGDTQVEGAFFMKIDGFSKEIEVAKLSTFEPSFFEQFKTEKDIKKNRDLEIDNFGGESRFYPKKDGGMVVITETFSQVGFDFYSFVAGSFLYFEDLVVYNFQPDGTLIWAKRVPKKQVMMVIIPLIPPFSAITYNRFASWWTVDNEHFNYSYVAGLSDDRLYIIYNDHRKNKARVHDYEKLKSMGRIKKSVPTVVSIDLETGAKTKRSDYGFASGDAKLQYTLSSQKAQGDTLIIFASKKRKYKYGYVDLNSDRSKAPTLEEEKALKDEYLEKLGKESSKKEKKNSNTQKRSKP